MHNLWLVWRIWKWPSVKRLPEYWALWMLLLVRAPYLCQWRAWLLCIHQRRLRNYRLTTIWALRSSEVGCNPPCVFLLFRIEIGNNMQMEVKFAIRRIWIHLLVISSMCTSCSISARTKKSCQVLLAFIWFLSVAVELFHNETNTAFNHVIDRALWLEISVCLTMVGYLEMKVLLFSASCSHPSYNLTTDQIRRISSVTIRSFTSTFSFDPKALGVFIRDILRALHMSSLDFAFFWTNCSSIVISIILFGRYLFCWLTIPLNGFHSNVVDHDGWGSSSPIVIDMNSVCLFSH